MSSGSAYSSVVYEVGAYDPSVEAPGQVIRMSGFDDIGTGGESGYDPDNPQFAPLGNVLLPFLMMALVYALVAYRRKTIKD